jgi:hypothetical protein
MSLFFFFKRFYSGSGRNLKVSYLDPQGSWQFAEQGTVWRIQDNEEVEQDTANNPHGLDQWRSTAIAGNDIL